MTKQKLKIIARNAAFSKLLEMQSSHKKVKQIEYRTLEVQPYLTSDLLSQKQVQTLTAIRSHCLKGIKENFPKMQQLSEHCPLKCGNKEAQYKDTQEHLLQCQGLGGESVMKLSDMYSQNIVSQANLAKLTFKLKRKREQILEDQEESLQCLPGASFLDPSIQLQQQIGAASICSSR